MIRLAESFDQCGNFFLGFCIFIGAAFVFQRSRRAALYVAIGGLGFMLGVPVEYMLDNASHGLHVEPTTIHFIFTTLSVGRHALLFGGLALAMRTLAVERAS